MNCKPGDLAMIIGDEESCIMNIGRIVHVYEPLTIIVSGVNRLSGY